MQKLLPVSLVVALAGTVQAVATRQPTTAGAVRLGADLTGVGAERAGNADGSIPAYTGGMATTAVDANIGYIDPFASDTPLYTITSENVDQYKSILSPGHLTLLRRDARTFSMLVYPTRRSAAYPDAVLAEVKAHAGQTVEDGYHIRNVGRSSVPFPIPTDGLQVMWNHVFRWRGGSFERQFIWAPVNPAGQFFAARVRFKLVFDQQGYMEQSRPGRLFNASQFFLAPVLAVGIRQVEWEPIDPVGEPRARWQYVPQTLDERRLPSYEYDQLDPFTGGMRTSDQDDAWNGAPDRYEWKLVGKRELIIGYNAFRLANRKLRYVEIIQARNLDPRLLRYEKHRVWVVEATARKRHIYYRRVFYVDEDTWQVAQEEIYDEQGRLTRFGDHQMIQFYDVQVPWYAATIHHDLRRAQYLVTYLENEEPFRTRWGFKGQLADFLPSNLRRLGLP